jgi:hypothetical protein
MASSGMEPTHYPYRLLVELGVHLVSCLQLN